MNHLASSLRRLLPGAFLMLLCYSAQSQDPGSGGPTPGAPEPTAVPLDGGASLLLAGGAAYALNRLRKRRQA
ncbi:PID-CTERM protein-sorting domain-containing protein [Hymenobacter jeollabukensis]|uniref:VPDSG-CTERM sorting domain-containing protein n=1 Tax=Hymenobacter jeollabukensis TaxID=2025313 RepID=A0A5R8WMV9_9BACT|nr:hypothetical protein [Hymenobacter jeollabukensis]TLM91078.1 hypothetical protein FDY95_15895 [Hymenobacter jeollabukensis]